MSTRYQMLEKREIICGNDEYLSPVYGWIPCRGVGFTVVASMVGRYRRPLTPATAQQQPSDAAQLAAEANSLRDQLEALWSDYNAKAQPLEDQLDITLARLTAALQQETK